MSSVTAVPLRPVKRTYLIYLWVGLALAVLSAFALARQGDPARRAPPLLRESAGRGVVTTASGLKYKVIAPGVAGGAKPTDADVALVQYLGRLTNGTTFDQSQQPTPMPVAGVVPGFSEALKLMPRGARYRIWLPPKLGYGDKAAGPIPPNSTLVFDLEMVDFKSQADIQRMQMQMEAQQQLQQGGAQLSSPRGAPPPR